MKLHRDRHRSCVDSSAKLELSLSLGLCTVFELIAAAGMSYACLVISACRARFVRAMHDDCLVVTGEICLYGTGKRVFIADLTGTARASQGY